MADSTVVLGVTGIVVSGAVGPNAGRKRCSLGSSVARGPARPFRGWVMTVIAAVLIVATQGFFHFARRRRAP